jgi:hypothetical protein
MSRLENQVLYFVWSSRLGSILHRIDSIDPPPALSLFLGLKSSIDIGCEPVQRTPPTRVRMESPDCGRRHENPTELNGNYLFIFDITSPPHIACQIQSKRRMRCSHFMHLLFLEIGPYPRLS